MIALNMIRPSNIDLRLDLRPPRQVEVTKELKWARVDIVEPGV